MDLEILHSSVDTKADIFPQDWSVMVSQSIDEPNINLLPTVNIRRPNPSNIGWVEFSQRAHVIVKNTHPAVSDDGVETLKGRFKRVGPTWLATSCVDSVVEFSSVSSIKERGEITPYAALWLGKLAQSGDLPDFAKELVVLPATAKTGWASSPNQPVQKRHRWFQPPITSALIEHYARVDFSR